LIDGWARWLESQHKAHLKVKPSQRSTSRSPDSAGPKPSDAPDKSIK
jgi:hypothetical protein